MSDRYRNTTHRLATDSFFDARLMRDSNEALLTTLLSNGHLIPGNLRAHAHSLVGHFDLWLQRFYAKLEKEKPTVDSTFDVGFAKEPFPKDAAAAFLDCFEVLRAELYGGEDRVSVWKRPSLKLRT